MSTFVPTRLKCPCGHDFVAPIARSVNAARSPRLREAILAGTFQRVRCPTCHRPALVERELFYLDLPRGLLALVEPAGSARPADDAAAALARAAAAIPPALAEAGAPRTCVVHGLAGLRELLVADEARISGSELAAHKIVIRGDRPSSISSDDRLFLTTVDDDGAHYAAVGDGPTRAVTVPAGMLGSVYLRRQLPALQQPGRKRVARPITRSAPAAPTAPPSPVADALALLADFSGRPDAAVPVDGEAFRRMLADLPRGSELGAEACRQLRILFGVARRLGHAWLQDALFEIRFAKKLTDVWSSNEIEDDIETLWDLLEGLPDPDVEGNLELIVLDIEADSSYYEPDARRIVIAAEILPDPYFFPTTLLHEVGHAVHQRDAGDVDGWLHDRFGWRSFRTDAIDEWVDALGGWGSMSADERESARQYIEDTLGPGERWKRAEVVPLPADHGWWAADCAPRLALEQTGAADWYMQAAQWRQHEGYAFFLNYYYAECYMVSAEVVELVEQMPDAYAAMSGHEFFAEMYALYHGAPEAAAGILPADVLARFAAQPIR